MVRIGIFCLIAFILGYVLAKLNKDKKDPQPNEELNSWREKHK